MKKGTKKAALIAAVALLLGACASGPETYYTDTGVGEDEFRAALTEQLDFFMDEQFDDYGEAICQEIRRDGEAGYKQGISMTMDAADGNADTAFIILSGAIHTFCPEFAD